MKVAIHLQQSTLLKCILVAVVSIGVSAEPIFFHGRGGAHSNRKRGPHIFSHRPHYRQAPKPHMPPRIPCVQYPPRTKYITKTSTSSIYETVYETEFFPKTVFDTRLKSPLFQEPSTVFKTSTTTSTVLKTKVEPVYITTTELEPTSITSTITHIVYDTRHLISSLFHTRVAPQVLTKTILQDVYHTDIETITNSKTLTVTKTETVVDPDCTNPPGGSGVFPGSNPFDSRNKNPFSPSFLASPYADSYNDISHANSDPLKTFTDPLPPSEFAKGSHQFGASIHGGQHIFPPSGFLASDSAYYPGSHGSSNNPFQSYDNKLFDFYAASHPNYNFNAYLSQLQNYQKFSQNAKSPSYDVDDDMYGKEDSYSPFTKSDIKFQPSRPDPTSISDIIDDNYSDEELPEPRKPKRLYGDEASIYSPHSIYHSGEHSKYEAPPMIREGQIYVHDLSDHGGDIHIKQIMKGVKGGEIHEEIQYHGLEGPSYIHYPANYSDSYHHSPYGSAHSPETPVYQYDPYNDAGQNYGRDYGLIEGYSFHRPSLLRQNIKKDQYSKQVHPLIPKQVEYDGHAKSDEDRDFAHHSVGLPAGVRFYGRMMDPHSRRTLFRSEVPNTRVLDGGLRNRAVFGNIGAHSTPVVTNVNGTEIINIYTNTSANTFIPSKLINVSRAQSNIDEVSLPNVAHSIDSDEFKIPAGRSSNLDKVFPELTKSSNLRYDNDWVPVVTKRHDRGEVFANPRSVNDSLSVQIN